MENSAVPVFKVEKKITWKNRVIRWSEIILIVVVVLGTAFWILSSYRTSFNSIFSKTLVNLKPKVNVESKKISPAPEEEIRTLLTGNFEISSISKTADGNLEVRTKEVLIIFSLEKDLADQVSTLQTIQAKAKIDNKGLKKVDFRFAKIVVEYL